MTLQQVIEQAVAAAFAAGAEWHAIVQCQQDSAKVGRQLRQWEQDLRYQQIVRHHQRQSAEAIGRAIMRLTVGPERKPQQRTLFNPDDEAKANAHLIAAAPDLYEACEKARNVLALIETFDELIRTPRRLFEEAIDAIDLALLKARGESVGN